MSSTETTKADAASVDNEALQDLVTAVDMGGRKPTGITAKLLMAIALAWTLFQLWYRITSYNVCYTKLLRWPGVPPRRWRR